MTQSGWHSWIVVVCVLRKMSFYVCECVPPMYTFNAPVSDLFFLAICAILDLGLGLTCGPQIHIHVMGNRIFYYSRLSQISVLQRINLMNQRGS